MPRLEKIFRRLAPVLVAFPIAASGAEPTADKRPRVATIVIGPDAAAVGDLQREIDDRVAAVPNAHAVPAAAVAEALAVPAPAPRPRDPEMAKKITALFDQATAAYYRDRAAQALEAFDQIGKLEDQDPQTPAGERVRFQLWRMAVLLALGDKTQADGAALQALALDPKIEIDTSEFPPSMQDTITDLRARRGRPVVILVSGLPAGGKITLDGRPGGERNEALAGRHRLDAAAPGRRPILRLVDAQADTSVRMPMALLLDTAMEAQVTGIVARGSATPADSRTLDTIGKRIGAEWLVLGGVARAARVIVVKIDGARSWTSPTVAPGAALSLVPFVTETLSRQMPRPPSSLSHRVAGVTLAPAGWQVETRGGMLFANRSHDVSGTSGRPLHATFLGGGPAISAEVTHGLFIGMAEVMFLDYGFSYLDVTLTNGSKGKVHGGTTFSAGLAAGARIPLGSDDPDGASLTFLAGFAAETNTAEDVADTSVPGGKLGAFSSVSRNAVDVRVQGRLPVVSGPHPVAAFIGVSGSPYSTWTESPAGNTGASPAPTIAFGWNAGADWAARPSLTVRLYYRGEQRGVRYSGSARGAAFSGMTDAHETDLVNAFGVTAGWQF